MTQKEKALQLMKKFYDIQPNIPLYELSQKCALIAVDEMLTLYKKNWNIENSYWSEVKTELEKL